MEAIAIAIYLGFWYIWGNIRYKEKDTVILFVSVTFQILLTLRFLFLVFR